MPTLTVVSRSGRQLSSINYNDSTTVDDLRQQFASEHRKYSAERQYFTIGLDSKTRTVLQPGTRLSTYSDKLQANDNKIYFKDLGPQISWKTVFHVEYAGPILIHMLNFFLPQLFYGSAAVRAGPAHYSSIQKFAFAAIVLHYLKRELETHFVHRFSNATMPAFNIFKNSTHYWIFGGVAISYFLYHPRYTPAHWLYANSKNTQDIPVALIAGALVWVAAELGNLNAHVILRNLRPPGTRTRGIPRGNLFGLVACANYTCE